MATASKKVTVIEPTILPRQEQVKSGYKLKVAAYARVSTENEEQATSYAAQVNYYDSYIKSNPDWEFVEVYADEGITGTNTFHREGFNRMINDARAGKIDLILTKSISRFARNTVDSISITRELRNLGVEVIFEKENLHSLDPKCEMVLTIMSSLAQEESRSISENIKWALEKRSKEGKVTMPYGVFLGYDRGEDGRPVINQEQAETVRFIYGLFLEGNSINGICHILNQSGRKSPRGRDTWAFSTVKSILTKPNIFDLRQRHSRPDAQKPLESSVSAGSRGFFFLRWPPDNGRMCVPAAAGLVLP